MNIKSISPLTFESIEDAITFAKQDVQQKFTIADETEDSITWLPMKNDDYQTHHYTLYKDNIQSLSALHISIYKHNDDKYELTSYIR